MPLLDPDSPLAPPANPTTQSPPGAPRRERNAAATKVRLLDAAEREFAARGFQGARLREIAGDAGVQPALIHHYFADKQGLYRAVLDRALYSTSTESLTLLGSARDLDTLLQGLVEMLLRFYAARTNVLAILRHEAVSGSSVLEELTRERTLPVIEALRSVLLGAQARGELRADVPADELILAGMAMVAYPFVEAGLFKVAMPSALVSDEASLIRRRDAVVTLLLGGARLR